MKEVINHVTYLFLARLESKERVDGKEEPLHLLPAFGMDDVKTAAGSRKHSQRMSVVFSAEEKNRPFALSSFDSTVRE